MTEVEKKVQQPEEKKSEEKQPEGKQESSDDEHDHDHDHDHDHGQCQDHDHDHDHDHGDSKKSNRGDKKFKKAMSKMGLKPVSGINRVTIKKGKAFVISIDDPDVWKSPGNESAYIIFGKPNMDGPQGGQNEMQGFRPPVNVEGTDQPTKTEQNTNTQGGEQKTTEGTEDLSEEGLNPDNIKMVMEYTKCSKADAIRVLKQTGDDSVNAIMKLTK